MGSRRYLHIVTVGTSILRNAAAQSEKLDILKPHTKELRAWALASVDSTEDVEAGKNAVPGSPVFRAVLGYVASDPRRASAELNAFIGYLLYLEENYPYTIQHDLVLLSSDTGACWFTTRIIEEYLKSLSGQSLDEPFQIKRQTIGKVEARRIPMLGKDFWTGARNMLQEIKKILEKARGEYSEVAANLTAGFKPESGLLLVAANQLGITKAYYIHELMKNIIEIPTKLKI